MLRRQFVSAMLALLLVFVVVTEVSATADHPQLSAEHIVRRGETLSAIAQAYNISVNAIAEANGLTNLQIFPGQRLLLPESASRPKQSPTSDQRQGLCGYYVVELDDTVSTIAALHGLSRDALKAANGLVTNTIFAGQVLMIPCRQGLVGSLKPSTHRGPEDLSFVIVKVGDTLDAIAIEHGISLAALKGANGLVNDHIFAGQFLTIPRRAIQPSTEIGSPRERRWQGRPSSSP